MISVPIWLAFAVPLASLSALLGLVWMRDRERRAWFEGTIALIKAAKSRDDDDDQADELEVDEGGRVTCPFCTVRFFPADLPPPWVCPGCRAVVKP